MDNYPEKIDQRLNLAALFLNLNRVDDALDQYQVIREQRPEEMQALSQLNTIYMSKGEFDKAKALAKEAHQKEFLSKI